MSPAGAKASQAMQQRSGFTLLELLLALTVVSLIAAFSISAWFGRSEVTLENAVDLLVLDLRTAQARAIFFGEQVEVVFDADGSGYEVVESADARGPSPLGPPLPPRHFDSGAVFEGVRIGRIDLGADQRVVFDGRGNAVQGGTIVLTYGDEMRTVEIESGLGRIRLPERATTWDPTGH